MSMTDTWRPKRPGPASDKDSATRQTPSHSLLMSHDHKFNEFKMTFFLDRFTESATRLFVHLKDRHRHRGHMHVTLSHKKTNKHQFVASVLCKL